MSFISTLFDILSIATIFPLIISVVEYDRVYQFFNKYTYFSDLIIEKNKFIYLLISISLFTFFIKFIFSLLINYKINKYAYISLHQLRTNLISKAINSNYLNFYNLSQSDLINTIISRTHEFIELSLRPALRLSSESLLIVVFFILLFIFYTLETLLIFLLLILFIFFYFLFIRKKIVYFGKESDLSNEKLLKYLNYLFFGKIELDSLKITDQFLNKTKNFSKIHSNVKSLSVFFEIMPRYFLEFIFFIILLIILIIQILIYPDGAFINLSIMAIVVLRLLPSANILMICIANLKFSTHHLNKLFEFYANFEDISISSENFYNKKVNNLNYENISFSYKEDVNLIDNISFKIKSNEIFFIKGKSGSGKTTLLRIIMGMLKPKKGKVYINDELQKDYFFINDIFYLTQGGFFINDSVLNNITLFQDTSNRDKLKKFLLDLNLINNINLADDFLNKNVGENGNMLSTGQKQRLLFVRALYFNKSFIFMDEPTSNLDEKNVDQIINLISKLKNKFTIIVISHDTRFEKISDNILSLN